MNTIGSYRSLYLSGLMVFTLSLQSCGKNNTVEDPGDNQRVVVGENIPPVQTEEPEAPLPVIPPVGEDAPENTDIPEPMVSEIDLNLVDEATAEGLVGDWLSPCLESPDGSQRVRYVFEEDGQLRIFQQIWQDDKCSGNYAPESIALFRDHLLSNTDYSAELIDWSLTPYQGAESLQFRGRYQSGQVLESGVVELDLFDEEEQIKYVALRILGKRLYLSSPCDQLAILQLRCESKNGDSHQNRSLFLDSGSYLIKQSGSSTNMPKIVTLDSHWQDCFESLFGPTSIRYHFKGGQRLGYLQVWKDKSCTDFYSEEEVREAIKAHGLSEAKSIALRSNGGILVYRESYQLGDLLGDGSTKMSVTDEDGRTRHLKVFLDVATNQLFIAQYCTVADSQKGKCQDHGGHHANNPANFIEVNHPLRLR